MLLDLYRRALPGTVRHSQAQPEPDLTAPDLLYVDGVLLDYDLVQWDFQPNKDIHSENTGFGVVRIAWPELEASGTASFTLDFVPRDHLSQVLGLLLEVRPQRWLSYRGRRYRTSGFTPTYRPLKETPEFYRIEVSCSVYRPHKSLPPVPGTEIYPIADVRRYGGLASSDRILWVGGVRDLLVVATTAGLTVWNPVTGARFGHPAPVEVAGQVSWGDDVGYLAWGFAGHTYIKVFTLEGFRDGQAVIPVPFSLRTHRLQSDTLSFVQGGVLQRIGMHNTTVEVVAGAEAGLRANPIGHPAWMTSNPSTDPAVLSRVPTDSLGACLSGPNRVLVFRPLGVYLHLLQGMEVGAELAVLDSTENLVRFGVFGSPGLPEGYWLKDSDRWVLERYVPVTDPYGQHLPDANGDGWREVSLRHQRAWIRSVYADRIVHWGALQGIHYDGHRYLPYTEQHIFQVVPLL